MWEMIKLSEFASVYGVSERHARRLIKKYESDMVGHWEQRGNEGTFIDDEGVEILKGKLQRTFDMVPAGPSDTEKQLNEQLILALAKCASLGEQLADAERRAGQNAGAVALLEAAQMNVAQLEARVQTAEDIAEAAGQETERIKADHQAYVKLVEADIAAQDRCREEAEQRAADLQAELERLANASFWERRKILRDLKHKKE